MKNKITYILTVLLLCMSTVLTPMTAYAFVDTLEPELSESPIPSEALTLTPEGQATVIDNVTEEDGKEFFTFVTPAGNEFFLIIDRQQTDNNVYFLNTVTESDLLALAVGNGDSSVSAIPDPEPVPVLELKPISDPEPEPEPEPIPEPEPQKKNGSSHFVLIIITLLVAGSAGYYFKIVRPKQQTTIGDFDDDYEEEDADDYKDDIADLVTDDFIEEYDEGNSNETN